MKSLIPIINSLNGKEKRLLKKFFSIQSNGEEKKKLQLFTLILDKKVKTDEDAAKILYEGGSPNSAYSHVKRRLKKDILNFILFQDTSQRDVAKRIQAEVSCAKMSLQGKLLIQRGIYEEGEKLLKKALQLAEQFELYTDIVNVKNLLRTTVGYRKGADAYMEYSNNMSFYVEELDKWLKVRQYSYEIALPNEFYANKKVEYKERGAQMMKELEEMSRNNTSDRFTFWYYIARIYYHNIIHDFESSRDYGHELLEILNSGSIMFSKPSIATIHKDLASAYMNIGNHEKAIEHAQLSVDNFSGGMVNELRSLEYLFFAHLRNKDYIAAMSIVEKGLVHRQINSGNRLTKARWLFFRANLEYLEGDFGRAAKSLSTNEHIAKDKSGWYLGYKLLQMMIHIEENDLFLIDYQIKNFNSLLSRKKTENIQRAKVISKVIRLFMKARGNFEETFKLAKKEIDALSEGKEELFWDPVSYEVIRFDEWLRFKWEEKRRRRGVSS